MHGCRGCESVQPGEELVILALRHLVYEGSEDASLRAVARPVTKFDRRLRILLGDMKDTMIHFGGIGIAAPQVNVRRRVCIIGPFDDVIYEMVNPEIIETEGEQEGYEGCLSVPGFIGRVKRPERVTVKCQNRDGEEKLYTFSGFAAVAASHEIDHLDGIMYTDKAEDVHRPEDRPGEFDEEDEDE
jgi:peptide deformylase